MTRHRPFDGRPPDGADARPPDWDRFSALAEANYCTYIVTLPGTEVDDFPPCLRVRTTIPFAYLNAVVCRDLPTGAALDALIAETRASYAAHGSPHSWSITPFTSPADAGETLAAPDLGAPGTGEHGDRARDPAGDRPRARGLHDRGGVQGRSASTNGGGPT